MYCVQAAPGTRRQRPEEEGERDAEGGLGRSQSSPLLDCYYYDDCPYFVIVILIIVSTSNYYHYYYYYFYY